MTMENKIIHAAEQMAIALQRGDAIGHAYWKGYKEALEELSEREIEFYT